MRLRQHQPASRSCLPENITQWVCSCMQLKLCTKITSRAIAGPCCSEIVGYRLARRHACGTASAACPCAPLRIPQPPPDTHPQCTHHAPAACACRYAAAACTCTSASSHTTFKTPACKCTQHIRCPTSVQHPGAVQNDTQCQPLCPTQSQPSLQEKLASAVYAVK